MRNLAWLVSTMIVATPAIGAPSLTMDIPMSGAVEVPPGAPNGTGTAKLTIDSAKSQVCYTLTASGFDKPTMAHIHMGAAGTSGPVVVPLEAPEGGSSKGCAPLSAEVVNAIIASPSNYYVNVHSAAYPRGAIRGQLSK